MRTKFLINPSSGAGGGMHIWKRLDEACVRLGRVAEKDYSLEWTCHGQVVEQACRAAVKWDRVLAVGGDGTVRQVVEGLVKARRSVALGVIPRGTGNDFSRAIGCYHLWRRRRALGLEPLLEWLMTAPPSPVDVLTINDDIFFVSYCSIGFDAQVSRVYEHLRERPKMRALLQGRTVNDCTYAMLGLKSWRTRLPELRIHLDTMDAGWMDVDVRGGTCSLIVSNVSSYAGGARLGVGSRYNDGHFEVTVVPRLSLFVLLLASRLWPRIRRTCTLPSWSVQGVCLPLPHGYAVQVDGEDCSERLAGHSTLSIQVAGRIPVVLGWQTSNI
jgi:diacylglycerol kinase (ATP)